MLELLRLVSLRHLRHSPLRSLCVLFGIALGVGALVAMLAVNQSILGSFHESVKRVSGRADFIVTNGDVGLDTALISELADAKHVAHAAGVLEINTRRPEASEGPLLVLGIDFLGDRHFIPIEMANGDDVTADPLSFVNDPSGILISSALAKSSGLAVGSGLELLTPDGQRTFTVRGTMEDRGLAASFGGQVVVMFLDAAQAAFGREDKVDRIDIAVTGERADLETVRQDLAAVIQNRGRVERPASRTRHLEGMLGPIERALHIGGFIALLVGMLLIYNAVGVAVAQRRREIGILRALGVTKRKVVALFCMEALVLAVIGGALGVALGQGLAEGALAQTTPTISKLYAPIRPPAPSVSLELALAGIAAGLLATFFSAYWPSRRAAFLDPAETLRRQISATPRTIPHRRMMWIGSALLLPATLVASLGGNLCGFASMALFMLAALLFSPSILLVLHRLMRDPAQHLLGVPGRIAVDNAKRSLGRGALTVGALMMAVSTSVSLGSWAESIEASILSWLDRALPADLYVTAGSPLADQQNIPFRPEVIEKLADTPGVRGLYPVRIVHLDVADKRAMMIAIDMRVYSEQLRRKRMQAVVVAGPETIDWRVLYDAPRVVLGENAARRFNIGPGDHITFETPTGARDMMVYAVVVDYTSDQGTIIIDRRWYLEYWKDPLIDTVDLFVHEGADFAAVASEVRRRLGGSESLYVISSAGIRTEIGRVLTESLAIFHSLDLVALAVALLSVVGTMLAAVLDRISEIGVLRAIGATRRQIVAAVVFESGFLGIAAATGGVLAGIPMGWVFVRVVGLAGTGWSVDYLFPIKTSAGVAVAVILTATLAGFFPGTRAAKMDVPEALAYE